jgi:hypothetical protein
LEIIHITDIFKNNWDQCGSTFQGWRGSAKPLYWVNRFNIFLIIWFIYHTFAFVHITYRYLACASHVTSLNDIMMCIWGKLTWTYITSLVIVTRWRIRISTAGKSNREGRHYVTTTHIAGPTDNIVIIITQDIRFFVLPTCYNLSIS